MTGCVLSMSEALNKLKLSITENAEKKSRYELQQQMKNLEAKKEKAEIPHRYLNASFETFNTPQEDRDTVAKLKSWASSLYAMQAGFKQFNACIITGKNGAGKTHLGISILEYIDYNGLYIESPLLCKRLIRARAYRALKNEEMILQELMHYKLIVLDEIGRAQDAETEQHMIFDLVNMRYKENLPIVLISNKEREEFQDFVGKPVVDRFSERHIFACLNANSYRRKIARGEIQCCKP